MRQKHNLGRLQLPDLQVPKPFGFHLRDEAATVPKAVADCKFLDIKV